MHFFLSVSYGILVSTLYFIFFYLLGALVLPQKIHPTSSPFRVLFLGVAITVLLGWYSIKLNISLNKYLVVLPFCLLLFIFKPNFRLKKWISVKSIHTFITWLGIYAILYVLIYCFLPQASAEKFLPIVRIGNNDIFNYINITDYMKHLGNSNVAQYSYFPVYFDTPGVMSLFALFSFFYANDPLSAAMPLLYCISAFVGLLIVYGCHYCFGCSKKIATCIAAIIICGPFYRYIVGNYFLSSFFETSVFFALLLEMVLLNKFDVNKKSFFNTLILILPYAVLLLFLYPVLFFPDIIVMCAFFSASLYFSSFHQNIIKKSIFFLLIITVSCLILFCLDPTFFFHTMLNFLSAPTLSVGWSLPLFSPWMVMGIPSPFHSTTWVTFFLTGVFLWFFFYGCRQLICSQLNKEAKSFLCLVLVAFMSYWILFSLNGSTYQTWKFLSYYALPFCFALWCIIIKRFFAVTIKHRDLIVIIFSVMLILLNVFFFRFPLEKFEKKHYDQLKTLNHIKASHLWLDMSSPLAAFIAIHFIQDKQLHLLNITGYYPTANINQAHLSDAFFSETDAPCLVHAHAIKIDNLGCLYPSFPTLKIGPKYFVDLFGFSSPQSGGEWTEHENVSISLYVNKKDLQQYTSGLIKFEVTPFLYPGLKAQRVEIRWRKGHKMLERIDTKKIIALPYVVDDWKSTASGELKKITVHWYLPNAISPHQVDPQSSDTRTIALYFTQVSITGNVS